MLKILLSLLIASQSFAAISDVDKATLGNTELIVNGGFEADRAAWVASGGSVSVTSLAKAFGKFGMRWDSNAAGQTLGTTQVVTEGLKGRNGLAICQVRVPSGTATHKLQVYDGVNVIAEKLVTLTPTFSDQSIPFLYPQSGSITTRFISVNANEPSIDLDNCSNDLLKMGESLAQTFETDGGAITIGAVTTAPTKGTTTRDKVFYSVNGDKARVRLEFKQTGAGSDGSGDYLFTLPAGLQFNPSAVSYYTGACGAQSSVTVGLGGVGLGQGTDQASGYVIPYDATRFRLFVINSVALSNYNCMGSAYFRLGIASTMFNADFTAPIANSGSLPTLNFAQAAMSWSGYHDGSCFWTKTGAGFTNPVADASCNLVQRTNSNFGTVVSYNVSGNLPGIVFTPSRSGTVEACTELLVSNTSAGAAQYTRLTDGTTVSGFTVSAAAGVGYVSTNSACGYFPIASTAPVTIRVEMATSGGTFNLGATAGDPIVQWRLRYIDGPVNAPLVTGSVVSPNDDRTILFGASFGGGPATNCTTTPCTINAGSSSNISSVIRNNVGDYTIVFSGLSARPSCTCSAIDRAAATVRQCVAFGGSSTGMSVYTGYASNTTGGFALSNTEVDINCRGNK